MAGQEAEEARLCLLLKAAAEHLDSEAHAVSFWAKRRGKVREGCLECGKEIEACRLTIEEGRAGPELGWRLWSIFERTLDWDHLASDYNLGDEILDLILKLYF